MNIDWKILQWMHKNLSTPVLDFWMPKITMLGNMGIIWIAAAAALICTKKYCQQGIILLAGLAVGALVGNVILKHIIARPRPCWLDTSVPLLIANPTDYSFPSCHTLSSAIEATIWVMTSYKFGWIAILFAILIAFSRLYLYVHFPSDILGAACIGVMIGLIVFFSGSGIVNRLLSI